MKKLFVVFLMALILMPGLALAEATGTSVGLNPVSMPSPIYGQTFDNLALGFNIIPDGTEVLQTVVVRNEGTARQDKEINHLVLWQDDGNGAFDGFGKDVDLGKSVYDYNEMQWVFDGLNVSLNQTEQFFVSIDAGKNGTENRWFQMALAGYFDANSNGQYEPGDSGLFFDSGVNNLPAEKLLNSTSSYYKILYHDIFGPKIIIDQPVNEEFFIEGGEILIKGATKDQGGSFADMVEVCIEKTMEAEVCYPTVNTGANYDTWEYLWANTEVGGYTVYAKAKDFNNNSGVSNTITVTVLPDEDIVHLPLPMPAPEIIDYLDGRWIKTADSTAVYFLGKNNMRYAYPTQKVWASYFGDDFSFVETISTTEMASYNLVRNVPFKAGTLMKIPSVPKVYLVGDNAIIQWVTSEAVAITRFGANWGAQVKDLPESFFTDYNVGVDLF